MSGDNEEPRRFRLMKGLELTVRQILIAIGAIIAMFAVPEVAGLTGWISMTTIHQGLLWGMAALGLNLLLRHAELVSFGHAAFFGAGAYGGAMAVNFLGVDSGLLVLLAGTLLALIFAIAIGWFVADYLDIYFALLTLAFGQVLFAIALGSSTLGQDEGLILRQGGGFAAAPPQLFGLELGLSAYRVLLYYMSIVILLVSLVVMWRIINSPFGNALDAIGQDRIRARFIGIPVKRYVWAAFIISGTYGGIAGALYGLRRLQVTPDGTLFVFRSGEILFMAILGGFQTLIGPVVGGVVLIWLFDNARFITSHFELLTGVVLILVVYFLPKGVIGSMPFVADGVQERARNPSQISDDVSTVSKLVVQQLKDAVQTVKILFFGVK